MSSKYVATNKGSSTVGANFNATATAITLATGEGARFPSPTGGDYTLVVLQNTAGVREIICCVGRTADVLTVGIPGSAAANVAGRNYEAIYGMSAAAWGIGDVVSCRPTAALLAAGANASAESIAAAADKATPVDADSIGLSDSAAANVLKRLTWANLKATLKNYLDTLYFPFAGGTLTGDLTMGAGKAIVFEGTTDDAFETTLTAGDPTADRTVTTPDETCELGFRNIPQVITAIDRTCVLSDSGKQIIQTGSGKTMTIPANASVPYPIGTVLTFAQWGYAGTIAITTDTLYLAGAATTGSRTLANTGVATALKVAATAWIISGAGLS